MKNKIRIGAYEWSYDDTVEKVPSKDPDENDLGICDYNNLEIFIKMGIPDTVKKVTIMHELFHAFFASAGYQLKDDEENIVDILANQFVLFIKNNRKFFKENILK